MPEAKRGEAAGEIFLDHPISKFLRDERHLNSFTNKLWDKGVRRVGQLVQLTEQDIRKIAPRTSPTVIRRVKALLGSVDLALGMDARDWKNPDRPCKKKVHKAAAAGISARGRIIRGPRPSLG